MSFIAAIPFQGLQGLRHLERTLEKQQTLLMNSVTHSRDTKYFEDNISQVKTVEDLMSDRRLLRVALKAFGLQDDIGKTFFIKKILSSDTQDKKSLANRLNDKRYQKITKAFGFGDLNTPEGKTAETDFAKKIIKLYRKAQFEVAVGQQDNDLRLALNAKRSLATLLSERTDEDGQEKSENTYWYQIFGDKPLRTVFETALSLPKSIGKLNLEAQLTHFKSAFSRNFEGMKLTDFDQPEMLDRLVDRFLIRQQLVQSASTNSASIALTLLTGGTDANT